MAESYDADFNKAPSFMDRAAEIEKERQEAERRKREQAIEQERIKMLAELNTANETKDKLVRMAKQAANEAKTLADKIASTMDELVAATNNSHVGTSQFCSAGSSALGYAKAVQTMMSNAASGASAISTAQSLAFQTINLMSSVGTGGGGGTMTATMVHVAPEIAGARSDVASAAESISQACFSLVMLMDMVKMQSKDLQTAAAKMDEFKISLSKLKAQVSAMATDIDSTYKQYHAAQKDAIYRAALIPH